MSTIETACPKYLDCDISPTLVQFSSPSESENCRMSVFRFTNPPPIKHNQFIDVNQFQNDLLTKEKDSVVESHHTHSIHWSGQSCRDLPPLPSRGVIYLRRVKVIIIGVHAPIDQQHLLIIFGQKT